MKMPQLIKDLYADLRDRHLFPLVLVLVVAIVAVPVLLKSESEPPPPPDAAAQSGAALAEEVPTLPAVLASDPGLRDYRERLSELRSKNPFAQHFLAPKVKGATVENVGEPVSSSAATSSGASSSTAAGSTADTSGVDAGVSSTGTDTTTETVETQTEVQKYLIRHDLDVEIDGPSESRTFENVEELETLPGKKTPLVVYAGVTSDEREAVFLVSDEVVRTDGDGTCSPSRTSCDLLKLAEGKQRKLHYSPDGGEPMRYILKVHDIKRVVEKLN